MLNKNSPYTFRFKTHKQAEDFLSVYCEEIPKKSASDIFRDGIPVSGDGMVPGEKCVALDEDNLIIEDELWNHLYD